MDKRFLFEVQTSGILVLEVAAPDIKTAWEKLYDEDYTIFDNKTEPDLSDAEFVGDL